MKVKKEIQEAIEKGEIQSDAALIAAAIENEAEKDEKRQAICCICKKRVYETKWGYCFDCALEEGIA